MLPAQHKNLTVVWCNSPEEWEQWLHQHWQQTTSIWLSIRKKGGTRPGPSYEQAREVALRFGWIDSLPNRFDESSYLLRMTKRRTKSVWSKVNVDICSQLIAQGRMEENGLAEVTAAKADGRWNRAY